MNEQDNNGTIDEKPKLLGMITRPTEQFIKLKQQPIIWVPLIIISLLMMLGTTITALNVDYANDPELQESIEMLGIDEDVMIKSAAILAGIGSLFIPGFTALISTIIYLVIAKIIKKAVSFSQLYSMNVYVLFISAIGVLFNALLSFVLSGDSTIMFTSLAAMIQTDNLMVESVLSMIELFAIWGLILTIIGLQTVCNFSKKFAITIVVGFYILSLLFNFLTGWIATLDIMEKGENRFMRVVRLMLIGISIVIMAGSVIETENEAKANDDVSEKERHG